MKTFRLIPLLLCLTTIAIAAQPEDNLPAMKPITSRHTPARKAARHFMHGVNLANFLEVPPGRHWLVLHDVVDLREIKAQGFDHVRVPICWHRYAGPAPDYPLSGEIFSKADHIITNALALKLAVIINIHNFDQFTSNPPAYTPEFYAIWKQIAEHYAKFPNSLAFELLNEPKDAATTEVMNPIYARTIQIIRESNPHRTIFAGPGKWNSPNELSKLVLPDDNNIIVTLHCYDPFFFTHQGASWAGPDRKVTGFHFPGPPETPLEPDPDLHLKKYVLTLINRYNTEPAENNPSSPKAFLPKIAEARAWSEQYGRPVHFGEFGAFTRADQPSRARYYKAMREGLDAAGIGWAIWDWKSGFNYWDRHSQRPLPGMREALFPSKNEAAK